MKTTVSKLSWSNGMTLLLLILVLSSFSTFTGVHSFKIFLNNKLVIQEYLHEKTEAPRLVLDPASDEQVSVAYNQCGQLGTARKLIIKNGSKIVKKWDFADSPDLENTMTIKVKEIVALNKNINELSLYYSSNEVSNGQLLASIRVADRTAGGE